MIVQAEAQRVGARVVYRLYCEECHGYIGDISARELQALMSGVYGKCICFTCEDGWIKLFGISPCGDGVVWHS